MSLNHTNSLFTNNNTLSSGGPRLKRTGDQLKIKLKVNKQLENFKENIEKNAQAYRRHSVTYHGAVNCHGAYFSNENSGPADPELRKNLHKFVAHSLKQRVKDKLKPEAIIDQHI